MSFVEIYSIFYKNVDDSLLRPREPQSGGVFFAIPILFSLQAPTKKESERTGHHNSSLYGPFLFVYGAEKEEISVSWDF